MVDTAPLIEKKLSNGLTIRLKEIHTAPIISHWVWYRVGSRDELPGKTGLSHWVEHMQFKGTPDFPAIKMDKAISREGGVWNAFTYLDWTTYFETMPADKIDLGLRLEADRMRNSLFKTEEVESERTVIISEREGSENEPLFKLSEAVQASSFVNHPYHFEVIGDLADLRTITRDDLYQHYCRYYIPNNAVVTLAGDFHAKKMLERVEELYGKIPAGEPPPHPVSAVPSPNGEKREIIEGHGDTTFMIIAYRAPQGSSQDFFTFSVLDSLLTGPSSLNMFGGAGISNKTSRLYRSLVEREIATGMNGGLQATIDPFLYEITVTVNPKKKPVDVLRVIDNEIHRLQEHMVPEEDIHRAVKQAKALFAYGSENITNQAFWLGYAEMFASYDWFLNFVESLQETTPEKIQKVAQDYLRPEQRVIGIYHPGKRKARA
jgi:zinc protease